MSESSPAAGALLDAQKLVLEQLESRASAARLAQSTAHKKMLVAMSDHELAVVTARRATEAVEEVRRTFSRVAEPMLGHQLVPQSRTLHALNADVLIEIFGAWNATPLRPEDGPYNSRHAPAFVAASISKHCRAVALSTPSIWTDIYLDFAYLKDIDRYLDLVMTRARHVAQNVHIFGAPTRNRLESMPDDLMVRLLARCRTLDISFVDEPIVFHGSVLALLQLGMPLLEKLLLRLSSSNVRGLDMTSPGRHILTLCPKLRILNTGDLPFAFIDPKTLPVLDSYTTDSHLELDSLLEATRVWPKLTRLEIASVGTASSAVHGFRPAVMDLPLLETLVCRDADNPLHAIAADRLPALKHLDVFAAESAWLGIDAFLRNPQQANNLTTLTLTATHSNIIVDCWPPTINRLSNLESLRVVGFSAAGLEAFLTPWEHSYYLPEKLQEAHLIGCQFSGEAIECLIGWISRRNASTRNSPIKSLRIEHNGTNKARSELFPSWMVARLEQLVDNVKVQNAETYVPTFTGEESV